MSFSFTGASAPFLIAFFAVLALGPRTIEGLRRLKMRQAIGSDAPQPVSHQAKQGTPTMGGVLFLLGVTVALIVSLAAGILPQSARFDGLIAVFVVFVLHMGLGFLDDYLKATRGKAMGLRAREKLAGQVLIAAGFTLYLFLTQTPDVTNRIGVWGDFRITLWPPLYYALVMVLMIGMSNSVNLTDGLDGLAAGLSVLAFSGIALTALPLVAGLSWFGWAMAGACLGFLVYNGHPARVFMGDTGSLAIGASLAALAILGKQELPLLVFGLIFIIEALSVMTQIAWFKRTGKRIFKMAPIHHHFEMAGWKEVQVVQRFWIAGVVLLWLGLTLARASSPWLSVGQ